MLHPMYSSPRFIVHLQTGSKTDVAGIVKRTTKSFCEYTMERGSDTWDGAPFTILCPRTLYRYVTPQIRLRVEQAL